LFMNLEHLIPPFMDNGVTGERLLRMDSKELKSFGVGGDDKLKLKKKIKEMRAQVDKNNKGQVTNSGGGGAGGSSRWPQFIRNK
jgi:neurabin